MKTVEEIRQFIFKEHAASGRLSVETGNAVFNGEQIAFEKVLRFIDGISWPEVKITYENS